jgi:hypothetical protein
MYVWGAVNGVYGTPDVVFFFNASGGFAFYGLPDVLSDTSLETV